ncbi:MAG: tRNA (adenosine(37)-N6)-dimethylallyltransferase MiaA [Marinifilaceae bacterium]|jgi:tRNA dimethylallyltransferase|nr:tRNA (adenosine(37)-N6)-dimethylallyltransferase MiaA [Marinifilaceae bacterium]
MKKYLLVLLGPTGVGKTDLSIFLAEYFKSSIVSSDSRQIYKEIKIGTAVPDEESLNKIKHYFISSLSIHDYFNSWEYEKQAIKQIEKLHETSDVVLLVGGSMMYIDAVCKGIDDIPTIDTELRDEIMNRYNNEGIEPIKNELKKLDPSFYNEVDLNNHKRVIHALEVCIQSGKPYSSLRTNISKKRNFEIIKIGLNRDREELYDRINRRVDLMFEEGLLEEAKQMFPYKNLNSLNTVGYKELFGYFDKEYDLEEAKRLIKRNSRRYAKRQLSWFNRDSDIKWFNPDDHQEILKAIKKELN